VLGRIKSSSVFFTCPKALWLLQTVVFPDTQQQGEMSFEQSLLGLTTDVNFLRACQPARVPISTGNICIDISPIIKLYYF
jgi:hypothetical protein